MIRAAGGGGASRCGALVAVFVMAPGCPLSCNSIGPTDSWDDDDGGGCDPRATNGRCQFIDTDGDGIDDLDDDDWDGDEPPAIHADIAAAEAALGPADGIVVDIDDDFDDVVDVTVRFINRMLLAVDIAAPLTVTGADLGDGYGSVTVEASDSVGNVTTMTLGDVLIDLTPPVAELSSCLMAADGGAFSAWVGDAWALGSVSLAVWSDAAGEAVVGSHEFTEWPATFRDAWDWSYFSVPASALPVGASDARLTISDRVGNVATYACALTIDDAAPAVTLEATVADGVITATIAASDNVTEAALLAIALTARSAWLADGVGPATTFTLDIDDFPSGPLPLEGKARDRAGNEGVSAIVVVDVP